MKNRKYILLGLVALMLILTSCTAFLLSNLFLENHRNLNLYGKVIDQYRQPLAGVDVECRVGIQPGYDSGEEWTHIKTIKTDTNGFFQFTGLTGAFLVATPSKPGYEWGDQGWQGSHHTNSTPNDREIYTLWKLKGPEPIIRKVFYKKIQADGCIFTVDFVKQKITEGTNIAGDMLVQIQHPPQFKLGEKFDWSFVMTAIDGGFIEVTNNMYLNEAPESGYQRQYKVNGCVTNYNEFPDYPLDRQDLKFFLKSRGGRVYGHFDILGFYPYPPKEMAALRIEFYINPSGSRNLEFDPAKQIP